MTTKKGGKNKARKPATPLSKMQRRALSALKEAERTVTGAAARTRAKSKPLRVRVSRRLERKHPVFGSVLYAVIGLCNILGFFLKHGGRATGKAAKWTGVKSVAQVKAKIDTHKWIKALTEGSVVSPEQATHLIRRSHWRRRQPHVCGCGQVHYSVESLNRHFLEVHDGEPPAATARPSARIVRGATARTSGKVIVLPTGTRPAGRHRARRQASPTPAQALIRRHRATITDIGKKMISMPTLTAKIAHAFINFGDQSPPRHLAELREELAGFEQAMLVASEAIDALGVMLRLRTRIDGAVINPHLLRMRQQLEGAGLEAIAMIASIDIAYAPHIKAARGHLAVPDGEFFDKVG